MRLSWCSPFLAALGRFWVEAADRLADVMRLSNNELRPLAIGIGFPLRFQHFRRLPSRAIPCPRPH
ncbi:hypothetical protein HMPREF1550_00929 [Actinomyces sp. oral taxon 877 str. F0543]|nr:hypothetical protein HMPREF1550_00929 [Actinomyces sp. oral taxon 877 str. F0543]